VLFDRLHEHGNTIKAVQRHAEQSGRHDLAVSDFLCRHLVVDDIWVPLGEALLIAHYRPLWNVVVDGFGNHQPGGGREKQARSLWDTLHPGRGWALRLPESPRSQTEILELVAQHLSKTQRPDLDSVPEVDEEVRRALEGEDSES
jgi:hypothetical protein